MGTQSDVTSNVVKTPLSPDGYQVGQSATDKVGLYGATPVAQRAGADQVVVTAAVGTKIATGILADATASFSQTVTNNNNATIAASLAEIRAALVAIGLIKGSA